MQKNLGLLPHGGGGHSGNRRVPPPAAAPAATSTSTGPRIMGRPTRKDDVKTGVSSTTTMMTTAATTRRQRLGAPRRCPTGSGTSSSSPSKGTWRNSTPRGSRRPPRRDRDRPGVGGVGTPTTGLDDHRDPDGEKIEEGIEGGEDGRTHAREFERAPYVAQIAPPMLPRGRRREGVDRRRSSSMPGRRR